MQRFLAEAGVAARRKAEQLIVAGRVSVNGRVAAELGTRVDPARDRVELDGKRVVVEHKDYLLLHKPRGYVSTLADPEGRPTVMALLPKQGPRLYPVGRLDFNTEGLLLFTNDGALANGLMHPRREVPKTYHVKARGVISDADVAALEAGVELDGAIRKASVVGGGLTEGGKHSWIELQITEGRNRQVHRMLESLGHQVSRLVRVGYGPLSTERLARGKWRRLEAEEVAALAALAGVAVRGKPAASPIKRTGDRGRATGKRQSAGERQRTTDNGQRGGGARETGDRRPATGDRRPGRSRPPKRR